MHFLGAFTQWGLRTKLPLFEQPPHCFFIVINFNEGLLLTHEDLRINE